jgi:hypothetical protein
MSPLLFLLAQSAAVTVTGSTECPSPAAVAQRLALLLEPAGPGAPQDRVELRNLGERLYVRLYRDDTITLAEKTLDMNECEALAEAVAVMVAAWESELNPSSKPPEPAVDSAPQLAPAAQPEPGAASTHGSSTTPAASAPSRAQHRAWSSELSAAASWSAGTFGSTWEAAAVHRAGFGFGLALSVPFVARTETAELKLWRPHATLGPLARLRLWERWMLRARVGAGVSPLRVDHEDREREGALEPVLAGSLGVQRWFGRVGPYVEAQAALWPRPLRATVSGAGESRRTHEFELAELHALVGVAWRAGRRPSGRP